MSDEKRLLLHVGYPKTGTTTLQNGLFRQCEDIYFAGKLGRATPEPVNRFRKLINYGTACHIRARRDEVLSALREIWDNSGKSAMLLSLEGFTNPFVDTHYTQTQDVFRKISDIDYLFQPLKAEGVSFKLLVTLRPQTDLMPSLYSQIYLQGLSSGLFPPTYDGFLDFMFEDDVQGFGPDYCFDAYLDHCSAHFGAENVLASAMKPLFSGTPTASSAALAAFLGVDETTCLNEIQSTPKQNVRKSKRGRHMMVASGGANRLEKMAGINLYHYAFSMTERFRIKRGKPVMRDVPDRSARISAYYAPSNARLADKYGITI